jgi:hypothetical protein
MSLDHIHGRLNHDHCLKISNQTMVKSQYTRMNSLLLFTSFEPTRSTSLEWELTRNVIATGDAGPGSPFDDRSIVPLAVDIRTSLGQQSRYQLPSSPLAFALSSVLAPQTSSQTHCPGAQPSDV